MRGHRKTVLITGGAKGLGNYLGSYLGNQGYRIVLLDHNPAQQVGENDENAGTNYYEVDVSDWNAVNAIVDDIMRRYQGVDVLINNVALRLFKDFVDFEYPEIERYITVNLRVPMLLTRKLLPAMMEKGYGRIINISSKSALWGYRSGSMYCSTKSALIIFSEGLGQELNVDKDNVTINVICPDSFRKRDGTKLRKGDWVMRSIGKRISEIIESRRNSEVIPVLRTRTKLIEAAQCLRNHVLWLAKYS